MAYEPEKHNGSPLEARRPRQLSRSTMTNRSVYVHRGTMLAMPRRKSAPAKHGRRLRGWRAATASRPSPCPRQRAGRRSQAIPVLGRATWTPSPRRAFLDTQALIFAQLQAQRSEDHRHVRQYVAASRGKGEPYAFTLRVSRNTSQTARSIRRLKGESKG